MGEIDDGPVSTAVEETSSSAALDSSPEIKQEESTKEEDTVSQEAAPVAAAEQTQETEDAAAHTNGEPREELKTHEETKQVIDVATPSAKKKPVYVYDPSKITLRFLFANRDGLSVMVKCNPGDTVGEVKGALLSVWPDELPGCSGGDSLRLICMGKGILMPDSRTLDDLQVPVFRTHPTPINVAVRPDRASVESKKPSGSSSRPNSSNSAGNRGSGGGNVVNQGCACVIL